MKKLKLCFNYKAWLLHGYPICSKLTALCCCSVKVTIFTKPLFYECFLQFFYLVRTSPWHQPESCNYWFDLWYDSQLTTLNVLSIKETYKLSFQIGTCHPPPLKKVNNFLLEIGGKLNQLDVIIWCCILHWFLSFSCHDLFLEAGYQKTGKFTECVYNAGKPNKKNNGWRSLNILQTI